jgi:hypothetical protein
MGEGNRQVLRVTFDSCLKLEFHGSKVTSDAGLTARRGGNRWKDTWERCRSVGWCLKNRSGRWRGQR